MLGKKPLIGYTIEAAQRSKVTDIIVSTDSQEIINVVKKYNIDYILRRSATYSGDNIPVIPDVLNNVLENFQYTNNYDIVLVLEPTYPFRDEKTINTIIDKVSSTQSDWVVTISKNREHPHRTRKLLGDTIIPFIENVNVFSQRQDLPDAYMLRGAVYGAKIKNIQGKKNLNDMDWIGVIINEKQAIDIDEPIDFILAKGVLDYENK